jgi:hypothetical protein
MHGLAGGEGTFRTEGFYHRAVLMTQYEGVL